MTTFSILLTSVKDVREFVETASRYRCDVDVLTGRYIIDGKSIMGLFSIDLSRPVTVQVHGTDEEAASLQAELIPFVVQ